MSSEDDWEDGGDRMFLSGRHKEKDCRRHEEARQVRDAAYAAIGCRDLMRIARGEEPLTLAEAEWALLEEGATRLLLEEGKEGNDAE